jgi:hypothetical protein
MKSERRHELHTNMLADWLADASQRVKPYQNGILAVVILVAAGVVIATWQSHRSAANAAQAWDSLGPVLTGPSQQNLERATKQFSNSPAGHWANVLAGDGLLANGAMAMFSSKASAQELLGNAVNQYQAALKGDPQQGWISERATFGAARGLESLGRLDEAAKLYANVLERWPNGMFKTEAADRLKEVQKPNVKWFYDQFAAFNPKPAPVEEPSLPQSRSHIGQPTDNPPADLDLKYHSPFGDKLGEKTGKQADKAKKDVEKPKAGGEQSKPAAAKSAAEKPAAKPAAEKPPAAAPKKDAEKASKGKQ